MNGTHVVLAGAAVGTAALWTVDPLWALVPALLLVVFGLLLDDGGDA